ncbi:hypothetical protein DXV65_00135 [Pseudomonas fluorescens]|nr:hypothetical protein DXV65_00135 [Pseudomonas fluorescens]
MAGGPGHRAARNTVGAGGPAKVGNDNAGCLKKRGVFECFAGKPAPTGGGVAFRVWLLRRPAHPGHPRSSHRPATCPRPPG